MPPICLSQSRLADTAPRAGRREDGRSHCQCRAWLQRMRGEPPAPVHKERSSQSPASHLAAAVFGWGKWQGPSVRVDDLDELEARAAGEDARRS